MREIVVRLSIREALSLNDRLFARYIRNGCKLPIEDAPVSVQLRALYQELRTQRLLRPL